MRCTTSYSPEFVPYLSQAWLDPYRSVRSKSDQKSDQAVSKSGQFGSAPTFLTKSILLDLIFCQALIEPDSVDVKSGRTEIGPECKTMVGNMYLDDYVQCCWPQSWFSYLVEYLLSDTFADTLVWFCLCFIRHTYPDALAPVSRLDLTYKLKFQVVCLRGEKHLSLECSLKEISEDNYAKAIRTLCKVESMRSSVSTEL